MMCVGPHTHQSYIYDGDTTRAERLHVMLRSQFLFVVIIIIIIIIIITMTPPEP